MMAALEAGGATGVSSDGETRVDAARLAVVELQATLAQLKSSYTAITLRLSTLVGAPPPSSSVVPPCLPQLRCPVTVVRALSNSEL
jgi:outer membrane protein TolC